MADDSPSREDAHAALTALCAGAYGPKGGRKDYLFHLSSYHARVLMDLFGNLEAKCRQNRLEFDPTPAAPDQAEGSQPMPHRSRARIEQLASDAARWAEIDHLLQCPLRHGDPCDYKGHKAEQLWDPSYRQIL